MTIQGIAYLLWPSYRPEHASFLYPTVSSNPIRLDSKLALGAWPSQRAGLVLICRGPMTNTAVESQDHVVSRVPGLASQLTRS
jgi:hypothetical protein